MPLHFFSNSIPLFQVNTESRKYHTTPLTLLPVVVTLNRWQGTSALFKGMKLTAYFTPLLTLPPVVVVPFTGHTSPDSAFCGC